ncbi:MAG: (Fe-S)-binding protein, partial [Calditrichaeota bacterium]
TQELILRKIYPVPSRFRRLAKFLRLYQVSGLEKLVQALHLPALFSKKFATLSRMAPRIEAKFSDQLLPEVIPARGEIRYRVALLTGCVQDVAFATVNRDTAHVLAYDGCEVWIPRPQVCCGSLHGHIGDQETAARLAQQTLDIFSQRPVDAIIVNAAGCGSFMKHYARLFENTGLSQARRQQFLDFSARVKDIHEFLLEIGFRKPEHAVHATVTYHDACHLAHGQKITRAPREILQSIPGLQLVPLAESDWCCGSAGIYNITHTDTSLELLDRKMGHIRATGAQIVASANPGCNIQLAFGVKRHRLNFEVVHPVSLLRRAYGNL